MPLADAPATGSACPAFAVIEGNAVEVVLDLEAPLGSLA